MKVVVVILAYLIPAFLATIIINLLERYHFDRKLKKIDEPNSGKIYDFIKTSLTVLLYFFYLVSIIYSLFSGIYISNFLFDGYLYKTLLAILFATISNCLLFYGIDNF